MHRLLLRIAVGAVLIILSSVSAFTQRHKDNDDRWQVVEGCGEEVSHYPRQNYIYEASTGRLTMVDRIQTGVNRFVFTFRPSAVRMRQGGKLVFTTFPYGRERSPAGGRDSSDITDLYAERYGEVPGDREVRLKWDQTAYADVKQTGPWYAIYNYAGPTEPKYATYIRPLRDDELPADTGVVDALPNPRNYYSYRGDPSPPRGGAPVRSSVKKLSSDMALDTTGMEPGYYWFTLQSDAVFSKPYRETCAKTTPPVLIRIDKPYDPPPVRNIGIRVRASSTDCQKVTATAVLSLKNISARDVSVRWEILDQNDREILPDYTSHDGTTVAVTSNLKTGRYTFNARVIQDSRDPGHQDPMYRNATDSTTTNYLCSGGGAGLIYFQFEVPDLKKPGKVIDPRNPEGWTGGDPAGGNMMERAPYPTQQFPLFYGTTRTQAPDDGGSMQDNNTRRLNEIVEMLYEHPDYSLKIFGYADFQKTPNYSNDQLSERRIKAVKDHLVFRYREKYGRDISYRISGRTVTEARGARFAQSCDPYKWTDPRRWDRRTELIFTKDPNQPNPVYPPALGCPQPAAAPKPAAGKKPYRIPAQPGTRR